jgi:hypothetical protein
MLVLEVLLSINVAFMGCQVTKLADASFMSMITALEDHSQTFSWDSTVAIQHIPSRNLNPFTVTMEVSRLGTFFFKNNIYNFIWFFFLLPEEEFSPINL